MMEPYIERLKELPEKITISDTAKALHLSSSTIRRYISKGRLGDWQKQNGTWHCDKQSFINSRIENLAELRAFQNAYANKHKDPNAYIKARERYIAFSRGNE